MFVQYHLHDVLSENFGLLDKNNDITAYTFTSKSVQGKKKMVSSYSRELLLIL